MYSVLTYYKTRRFKTMSFDSTLFSKTLALEHFANNLQNYFIHQVKRLLIFIQVGYNFFMKNYSKTERIKAIRAVLDKNISTKQVALIFQCHVSTVYRWVDEYIETGKTQPAKSGEPPKKLDKTDEAKIQELVAAKKDITLAELVEAVGKNVSIATMHRCLQRLGITYKKNSKSRRTK